MRIKGELERPARQPGWWRGTSGVYTPWRMALFMALTTALVVVLAFTAAMLKLPPHGGGAETPLFILQNESLLLFAALCATALMAWLEGRSFAAAAGLGGARRLVRLLQGLASGVALMGAVLLVLWRGGYVQLTWGGLSAAGIAWYGLIWLALTLLIAFTEELTFRGYVLQTPLRSGQFWGAAFVTSLIFGGLHFSNNGEGLIGVADAGLAGFIMAMAIRGTGTLWWAIGFHGGWDYAESFLFGTADSGQRAVGALLHATPQGAAWVSGGATGPEGSVFGLGMLTIVGLFAWRGFLRPRRTAKGYA
jgi:membrane protease YdiL (CAAX protease family)